MTTEEFKRDYYLEKTYKKISETEFDCKLTMKREFDNTDVTEIKTKINILEVVQDIADTQFEINPITWQVYSDEIVIMQFHLLMIKIKLTDIDKIDNKRDIVDFFRTNPFYED